MSGNTRDFVASTYYFVGDLIKDSGVVYRRTIAGDAGATFNAAEKVNWAILSGFPFTTVAANYTVVETDEMIVVTSTTAFTITIPAGRVNPIIKFSTPSLSATPPTITTSGGETITSPTTFALVTSFVMPGTTGLSSSVQFQKIGNNYMFIA